MSEKKRMDLRDLEREQPKELIEQQAEGTVGGRSLNINAQLASITDGTSNTLSLGGTAADKLVWNDEYLR